MKFKPNEEYDELLERYYQEMKPVFINYPKDNKIKNSATYNEIRKWKPAEKTPLVKYLIQVIDREHNPNKHAANTHITFVNNLLFKSLIKSTLGVTEGDLKEILTSLNKAKNHDLSDWPITHAVNQIGKYADKNGMSGSLKAFIEKMLQWDDLSGNRGGWKNGSLLKSNEKLQAILFKHSNADVVAPEFKLSTYDMLGIFVNKKIDALGIEIGQYWHQLFELASKKAEASKPTKKYLKEADEIIKHIGEDIYYEHCKQFFKHLTKMDNTSYFIDHVNSLVVKGLVWTMINHDDDDMLNILADMAERCLKKDPESKPASLKIGNSCILVIQSHAEK